MLHIHSENLLGQGRQKTVYHNPENRSLCIKIPKDGREHSLKREIKYTQKHQQKFHAINTYRGAVETNLGTGHLFDIVRNPNGEISMSLEDFMKTDYDKALLQLKTAELYKQLVENKAALSELQPCNILIEEDTSNDYRLVIIDGFGNSDFIKICDFSRHFLKKKLYRKFSRFCRETKISPTFLK